MTNYEKFRSTHAILYQEKKILVQSIGDGEFATEEDWDNGGLIGSFAIDEDNKDMPTTNVWILDKNQEEVSYKDAESPIRLIKISKI